MLKWERTEKVDPEAMAGYQKSVCLKATLPGDHVLKAYSHPYSDGRWSVECSTLFFGGKYNWLDAHVGNRNATGEEEVKQLAENALRKFLNNLISIHKQVLEGLDRNISSDPT